MVRIAVIGAGRMGKVHSALVNKVPGAELAGIYDLSPTAAKALAEKEKTQVYLSLEDIIADDSVDAVVMCHPTHDHYSLLRLFMSTGKYILGEKPMVRHRDEAEMIRKMPNADTRLAVGFMRRQNPGYVKIKEMIDDGTLGTVRMVKVGCCVSAYSRGWDDPFFADFALCGGVALDMMSHHVNMMNWYFGPPRTVMGASLMFDRPMDLPIDYVSSTFIYPDGMIANVEGSWQRQGIGYDTIEVYGDKATALFDQKILKLCTTGKVNEIAVGEIGNSYEKQMAVFVDTVAKKAVPPIGVEDGYWAFRTADAMIQAAKSGQPVNIDL